MAENIMAIVNIFILPLISIYIYMKRKNEKLLFTFENVCIYAIFLVFGVVFNKAILFTARLLLGIQINMVSGNFTLIGIFTSFLLPILFEIVKKHLSIKIEEKNEKK